MQDRDRALVVGHTSFGKGSVQSVFPLADQKAALKLTTALYYTPSGRSIHRKDLEPEDIMAFHDEEESPQAAPADSARPVYHTAAGRAVYGGGGIAPDIAVQQDSLPPIVLEVEQQGLPFRFANRWVNTHDKWTADRPVSAEQWRDFVTFMHSQDDTLNEVGLEAQRTQLEHALRRELARRLKGDAAAAQIVLEDDAVFQRARDVLERAHRPDDVFAGISSDADAPVQRAASR
jgi:hypothetical protein